MINVNLWKMTTLAMTRSVYSMLVVDNFTRKMWVYLLERKVTLLETSKDDISLSKENLESW